MSLTLISVTKLKLARTPSPIPEIAKLPHTQTFAESPGPIFIMHWKNPPHDPRMTSTQTPKPQPRNQFSPGIPSQSTSGSQAQGSSQPSSHASDSQIHRAASQNQALWPTHAQKVSALTHAPTFTQGRTTKEISFTKCSRSPSSSSIIMEEVPAKKRRADNNRNVAREIIFRIVSPPSAKSRLCSASKFKGASSSELRGDNTIPHGTGTRNLTKRALLHAARKLNN